jgi:hypothetical protein
MFTYSNVKGALICLEIVNRTMTETNRLFRAMPSVTTQHGGQIFQL